MKIVKELSRLKSVIEKIQSKKLALKRKISNRQDVYDFKGDDWHEETKEEYRIETETLEELLDDVTDEVDTLSSVLYKLEKLTN